MIIRKIEPSELDKCVEGAKEFFSESGSFRGEFNPSSFRTTWESLLNNMPDIVCFFILQDNDGNIQGGIAGIIYPDYITGLLVATEMFWFIRKQCRGRHGLSLFNEYERWAKERGCKKVRMVHLSDLMPDKLRAFYTLRGYSEIETTYEKVI